MQILYTQQNETVVYAAQELKKYLLRMTPDMEIELNFTDSPAEQPDSIRLGLLQDFGWDISDIDDLNADDVIDIRIADGCGCIAGSNFRSILQGVYCYLKSAGCLWVRPGIEGEYIPACDMRKHSCTCRHKADLRTRGEVSEGAVSFENVADAIIWSPKVGYNAFYMQFVSIVSYFRRWYEHPFNKYRFSRDGSFDISTLKKMSWDLEKMMHKHGLQLITVGHAYMMEPYGVSHLGPGYPQKISDDLRSRLALVRGKRDIYKNSPNYTQLCYSNEDTRRDLVEYLVKYAQERPYLDIVKVGFSDNWDNHCECEKCQASTPSDLLIHFLNEVDAAFTEHGIRAKIGFSIYVDTLWPPVRERFNNPDRFSMSIALQRNYNQPLSPARYEGELPKWERNHYTLKPTSDLVLRFSDEWKKVFDAPRYSFDYDLYNDHFFDPSSLEVARSISRDLKQYPAIGLNGRVSCQSQRCAFPTALPNAVMGETLFDLSLDFDAYADRYFHAAYGEDWKAARAYLEELRRLFAPRQLRTGEDVMKQDTAAGETPAEELRYVGNPDAQQRLASIPAYIDTFLPTIERNCTECEDLCHIRSWKILRYHATYCRMLSEMYLNLSRQDRPAAMEAHDRLWSWLSRTEEEVQPYFDLYLFARRSEMTLGTVLQTIRERGYESVSS